MTFQFLCQTVLKIKEYTEHKWKPEKLAPQNFLRLTEQYKGACSVCISILKTAHQQANDELVPVFIDLTKN